MNNEKSAIFCHTCKKNIFEGEGRYIIGGFKKVLYSCINCYHIYITFKEREQNQINNEDHISSPFKKKLE